MPLPHAPSPDGADEWIAAWTASVSERAAQAQEMSERVAALSVSASGADGAVTVTVSGSGNVTDLWLDPRIVRWPADEIARQILATMRRA